MTDYIHFYASPLGRITIGSDGKNIIGLWFEDSRFLSITREKNAVQRDALPVFQETDRWLDAYFAGKKPEYLPPLKVRGTPFQKDVCRLLLEIPYGRTITYGAAADRIAEERGLKKMSAQAVGRAAGRNPVSILIPCHRMVGSDGNLRGYSGGLERKIRLLELEGVDMAGFMIPEKGKRRAYSMHGEADEGIIGSVKR